MLFLATTSDELVQAAGLLLLFSEGFVEPVLPPPQPRHLVGQQLLALALQKHQVGRFTWSSELDGLGLASPEETTEITDWMLTTGYLDVDTEMIFVGPETERRYGHRHFLELLSVFSSAPQFLVVHGRRDLGTVDPFVLTRKVRGERVIALAGRGWLVNAVDWSRRKVYVEPADAVGEAHWSSVREPHSFALTDAQRRVLLGTELASVELSQRAKTALRRVREEYGERVDENCTLVLTRDRRTRWWTWAGGRANAILIAALEALDPSLINDDYVYDNRQIGLRTAVAAPELRQAIHRVQTAVGSDLHDVAPFVTERAMEALKFSDLLPRKLARQTLEARLADPTGALSVLRRPVASAV